jgi:hypothetical protein
MAASSNRLFRHVCLVGTAEQLSEEAVNPVNHLPSTCLYKSSTFTSLFGNWTYAVIPRSDNIG